MGKHFNYTSARDCTTYFSPEMRLDCDKTVLDATAGLRKLWIGRDASKTVFIDVRRDVLPDGLASNECLPFRNGAFERVEYDPPHVTGVKKHDAYWFTGFGIRFGGWPSESRLLKNMYVVNDEFHRVLRPGGSLVVKWTDIPDQPSADFLVKMFTNFLVVSREERISRSGSKNRVWLVTFKRIDPQVEVLQIHRQEARIRVIVDRIFKK